MMPLNNGACGCGRDAPLKCSPEEALAAFRELNVAASDDLLQKAALQDFLNDHFEDPGRSACDYVLLSNAFANVGYCSE